jgi:2-phospho-L-lactate/phosphoenolpyruvate guanylyltransferase
MTRVLAVIPVRGSSSAKTRLAPLFTEDERLALVWSMLQRLLAGIALSRAVDHTLIVTRDPAAMEANVTVDRDATVLLQADNSGLNAALALGRHWATERGYDVMLVLPGDLPLVTASDLHALLDARGDLVVAPDRAGEGTNAMRIDLRCWAGRPFRFRMGPGSYAHHLAEAGAAGCVASTLVREGIAHDLDAPADWADLPFDRQRALLQDIHDSLNAAGYLA